MRGVSGSGRRLLLVASLFGVVACAKARPESGTTHRCLSWKEEIGPLFTERCAACHAGATPAGQYLTDSYTGVLGGGSDATPNAIAGDAGSRLLFVLDPATADDAHRDVSDTFAEVRTWVLSCNVAFLQSSVHPGGIMNPDSGDFHGKLLREQKYAFGVCQKCHGTDFAGGSSGVSCLGCHSKGPTDCSTCHGAIASKGSHAHHLGAAGASAVTGGPGAAAPLGKSYGCQECHVVPTAYTDVGHIFLASGELDPPPAEVKLGATAALTPAGATRAAEPSYDPATQSCSNVYCHGAVLADTTGTNTHPVWSAPATGQADCGTCHGLPPNHANGSVCSACHPAVVDKDRKIVAPDLHIDGKVDFAAAGADATAGSNCAGCHGSAASPAPPRSLAGQTAPTARGVGAHQAHLQATAHLRGPIACNECHRVPAEVSSAGHFTGHGAGADADIAAEVFPPDPTVGVLAQADGATPAWDVATATCSGVYCHGGGAKLRTDTASIDRAPVWTAAGDLGCGSACHGLPPVFAPHMPSMARTDCASCHPRTVDPAGNIIVSGAPGAETSAHMNGALDVAP